jgi:hypothetical protein
MAISFKDKIAYVNKFADKSDEKLQKVIKLSVNIESPKLNLTDAQKDKIKSSLQTAFERIKKIENEKGGSKEAGKKLKTPNLLQLAKQIKQKQGITFEQARTKAKQAFAAKKSGQANAIQAVLQDFKKKVGKIEYSRATTYVSNGVTRSTDIKRDMERPALKAGKRKVTTQGSTTNAYGTFKNKVGKVYYESRANRMDVNQPSKKRYPKLAKGGRPIEARFEDKAYVKGNPIGKKAVIPIQMDKNFSFYEYMQNFKKPTGFNVMGIKDGKSVKLNDAPVSKKEADKMYDQAKRNGYSEVQIEGVVFGDGGMTNFSEAYVIVKENRDEANDFEGLVFSEEDFMEWLAQKSEEEGEELDEDDYKLISVSVYNPKKMADGGFVAVGEKDGYWTIMTKPTTKEKAQKMLDIGFLPKGEIGKVVTVEEAKDHKKVIGREYLAEGGTLAGSLDVDNIGFGVMAKGGRTATNYAGKKSKETWGKHDLSKMYDNNLDLIADLVDYIQDLRKDVGESNARDFVYELMDVLKEGKITYNDGATLKFEKGGMFKVGDKVSSSMFTEGVIESKKKLGDETLYFVTYQSSENPNKNNSTVLRESEMTKIRKSKMARGGLTEHGLKIGDKILSGRVIGTTIRVRNENSNEDARVDLNKGKRIKLAYDAKTKKYVEKKADGGKVQYNRRKK